MKLARREWLRLFSLAGLAPLIGIRPEPGHTQCLTTDEILGPFYLPGAPETMQLAPPDAPGTRLFITGTVFGNDCETPIPGAKVDVWHANDGGQYEDTHYRGLVFTDENGQYSFETVLPGKYLNGSQFRPRHFHYKVSARETELTTQIYFEGDTSIPIDPWASAPDAAERIIPLTEDSNGHLHGLADIYLDTMPVINGSSDQKPGNGRSLIEGVFPNPLSENGRAHISLAAPARVSLKAYQLDGQPVHTGLEAGRLEAGRHQLAIVPRSQYGLSLPPGVYILQLWADDHPVDVKRFVIGR